MKKVLTTTCSNKKSEEYIRHEYPKNGIYHPFDINSSLQHFLFASGYTYLMKEEELKLIPQIKKVIPKNYMPFDMCERCFMIYKGNLFWQNPNYKENEIENYKIFSIYKEKGSNNLYSNEIESTNDLYVDIERIKQRSKKIKGSIYLFAKIL